MSLRDLAAAFAAVCIVLGVALLGTSASAVGTASDSVSSYAVKQPRPPVTSIDFPLEPQGQVPRDGDELIPNPSTPTGSTAAPPSFCDETFSSDEGATSARVNAWITSNENVIRSTTVICLSGTFDSPIHIWSKTSVPLLEIAPTPGSSATLDLGTVRASDTDPNQYWSDTGGVSIVDSRSVEIYGLTVENYTFDGPAHDPAGIYVTTRSDTGNSDQSVVPHRSACFLHGGSCSDIYILDNTVRDITNSADSSRDSKSDCGNPRIAAYGIAVIAAGSSSSPALQHVVVEGNTVSGTRTGQSETVTFNGDVTDFLAAGNTIDDADNIGLDTIGWETGSSQANHGLVEGNTVYSVDTWSNDAYGRWTGTTCAPRPENAAGLYDDGASYIWFESNTLWNTDQGINLDVETANKETDHLLVSGNVVHDDPGTSASDPSYGKNPPGFQGTSLVAGHDPYALYIDAFGNDARIRDVYVHDNTFQNESQHFLEPSSGMPVVDLGGRWSNVQIWHNTIEGMGASDRYNPLFEVDSQPSGGTNTVNCNEYEDLSSASDTVNGNFALPDKSWLSLQAWQDGNRHGWDADSSTGSFSDSCPANSIN